VKKMLVATTMLGLAAIVAPVANAEPVFHTTTVMTARIDSASSSAGDTLAGGCYFLTDLPFGPLATRINQGVIGDVSASRNAAGLPTGATVTCEILVNGVLAFGTRNAYPGADGVQAGVNQIEFTASSTDSVGLCEQVTFADGSTVPLFCQAATSSQLPPQAVIDLIDGVFAGTVDPIVCPELRSLAGSYTIDGFGVVITTGGDIYIDLLDQNFVYDCPPYAT